MEIDLSNLGLRPESERFMASPSLRTPPRWTAPHYIDLRPYCLPTDDQSNHPICVGMAVAGWLEVHSWMTTHIPQQFDALAIYNKAKELDADNGDGTTLEQGIAAAKALGYLSDKVRIELARTQEDVQFALHRHGVIIAGFNVTEDWRKTDDMGWIGLGDRSLGAHTTLLCWMHQRDSAAPEGYGWQNSWSSSWGINGFGRMTAEQFRRQFRYGVVLTDG